ncbi:beta strand repeat-containing protein [Solicola sp. PLA-1-18]|uniref:beta strand repeat-containing protein n=1 Tax=Solicola sp. PLA-1-18 TaxID=3380532 RepID=UPI003B7B9DEE
MSAVASAVVLGGLVSVPASAAGTTSTWTGDVSSSMNTAANWSPAQVPVAGDALVFPAGSARTTVVNDLPTGTSFESIRVGGAGYSVSGNAIELTGGLTADYTSGTSAVATPISNPGAITVGGSGVLALNAALSGTSGITKTGSGTVVLGVANTYAGVTSVNQGTLAIANSSALGSTTAGNVTDVAAGATLEVRGTINTSELVRIAGQGAGGVGALYNGTGNNVVQSVTMAADATVGTAANTFMLIPTTLGQAGGPFALTKAGAGVLDVLATASYTGGTVVAAGTLATEGTVNGSVDVLAGGTVSGAGGNLGDVVSTGGTVTSGFSTSPFTSDVRSLDLDADSTFYAQLNGTAAGNGSSGHSRVIVADAVDLDDARLTTTVNGYTPAVGDVLTILTTTGGVTGSFAGLPEGARVTAPGGAGRTFRISYVGGDGNDVTLTSVADAAATSTALSTSSPSSEGAATTLTATVTPAGATGTVTFKDGSTTLGTASVSNGTATLTTAALSLGSHSLTATYDGATEFATSTSASVTHVVADTTAPQTTLTGGPAQGSVSTTDNATFDLSSDDTGAEFECSLDGAAPSVCASPFTITDLADGAHTLTVAARDSAGNVDATPATRTWRVDTTVPAPPTPPVVPAPSATAVSGVTKAGKVYTTTSRAGVVVAGRGTPGAVITVRDGSKAVATTTVATNGRWSVRTSTLGTGTHRLTATQTVGARSSAPAAVGAVTVERVKVTLTKAVSPTAAKRPTVRGRGNPGATITVRTTEGKKLGTTTVKNNGTWRLRSTKLDRGTYTIRATQKIARTTTVSKKITFRTTARR